MMIKDSNDTKKVYNFALISLFIISFFSLLTSKFYSSDGAHYLFYLIRKEELFSFHEGRLFAQYLLKVPAWLAIKFGVTNFDIVSTLLGIPLYLQIIISLMCTKWFLLEKNQSLILFPILSIFIFILNTEYAIESEAITLASAFWPVYAFIYQSRKIEVSLKSFIFIFFVLILPFTYETFFLCSIPLIYLVIKHKTFRLPLRVLFVLYYLSASVYQLFNTIHHAHPQNSARYIDSIFPGLFGITPYGIQNFTYINFYLLWMLFLTAFFVVTLVHNKHKEINYPVIIGMSFCILVATFINPHIVSRYSQFMTRTLTSLIPILFMCLIYFLERSNNIERVAKYSQFFYLILSIQVVMSLFTTSQWHKFSKSLNDKLKENNGIFAIDVHQWKRGDQYPNYNFQFWSLPIYSIFLSDKKNIHSIAIPGNDHFMVQKQLDQIDADTNLMKYGFEYRYE